MGEGIRQRQSIPMNVLFELRDRSSGEVVFSSRRDRQFKDVAPGFSTKLADGTLYYVDVRLTPHWQITVAQEWMPTGWLIKEAVGSLAIEFLIAVPLVLIPVWLAVWLGMRPLRNLAQGIAARDPDDLTPIRVAQKHAELRVLAEAFNVLLVKLGQRMARERSFIHDAAHELRTPMAVVAVQAHAVANARSDEERAAAEDQINVGLARASHLIQQLLMLARMDVSRKTDVVLSDLVPVVREDLAAAAPAAIAKQIDLGFEAPDSLERSVEVHAVHSIVGNLVDNAIRYGDDGGRVVVALQAADDGWELTVSDDGPGIPVAERERVFERFYRGSGHDTPGTGLGLPIVRMAAQRLGGHVEITDGLDGRGCTFSVRVLNVNADRSPRSANSAAPGRRPPHGRPV
jgi:signal transduction histidine kinase